MDKRQDNNDSQESHNDSDGLVLPGEESNWQPTAPSDDQEDGLEPDDHQSEEIREIFGTAFPQYLQPIEEITEQLFSGEADQQSIEALTGMLSSLMEASSRMGFDNIFKILNQLQGRVSSLGDDLQLALETDVREGILGDIVDLYDLAAEMGGGSGNIPESRKKTIYSALRDKEGVGNLVLRRLSAAGLITVDQLLMARPEEIAAVAGLDIGIVNTILSHLSDEDSDVSAQSTAATPGAATESSKEVASLHERVVQKLHTEAEMEASLENIKAEIRKLRSSIFKYRTELQSLDIRMTEKAKAWNQYSEKIAVKSELLDELRAKRDAVRHKYASSEEALQQKELRLQTLKQEQRNLEVQSVKLGREVGWLVDRVGEVLRAVAKKRLV